MSMPKNMKLRLLLGFNICLVMSIFLVLLYWVRTPYLSLSQKMLFLIIGLIIGLLPFNISKSFIEYHILGPKNPPPKHKQSNQRVALFASLTAIILARNLFKETPEFYGLLGAAFFAFMTGVTYFSYRRYYG